jgi:hypothetical protein
MCIRYLRADLALVLVIARRQLKNSARRLLNCLVNDGHRYHASAYCERL